jgi:hypothetical protein
LHVLKRWATWQGTRWIAAVAGGLIIAYALFVPIADSLAHHDVGSVKGPLHETAVDNVRRELLTLGAGVFAVVALAFTARTFYLSRRTFELTEQGQVTDRYTKAIEQLGSEKLDVRIGGIYALERVAHDSARDHPTVMEVLTAFIREHSREPWPQSDHRRRVGRRGRDPGREKRGLSTRPDVQAAVTVIGRRDQEHDLRPVDLTAADLSGANLGGVVPGATFWAGAVLGADLSGAILRKADLSNADLTNADLSRADLTGAKVTCADLTGADLTSATWPADARIPEGWKLNTRTGRLVRTGTPGQRRRAN